MQILIFVGGGLVLVAVIGGVIYWVVKAQGEADDVLVMSYFGELWIATEDEYRHPVTLANCGIGVNGEPFESPLLLSPNHEYVAYVTRQENAPFNHVRLCDGAGLNETLIGPQPEDFDVSDPAHPVAFVHSWPVWSPDGCRLAWVVYSTAERRSFIVAYDVKQREASLFVPEMLFPFTDGGPLIAWGNLALVVMRTWGEGAQVFNEFLCYDPGGVLRQHIAIPYMQVSDFFFVEARGQERLAVVGDGGVVSLLNVGAARWEPLAGELEMVGSRRGGLTVRYQPATQLWEAVTRRGQRFRLDYDRVRLHQGLAIAPGGRMIAYVTDKVYLWRRRGLETVGIAYEDATDPRASVVWTPLRWRVVA